MEEEKWLIVKIGNMNMFFANEAQYNEYLESMEAWSKDMAKAEAELVWGKDEPYAMWNRQIVCPLWPK